MKNAKKHLRRVLKLLPTKHRRRFTFQENWKGDSWLLCSYEQEDSYRRDLIGVRIEQSMSDGRPFYMKINTSSGLHFQSRTKVYRQLKTKRFNYKKAAEHINGLLDKHDEQQALYDEGASIATDRIKDFESFINSDPKVSALNVEVTTHHYENDESGEVDIAVACKGGSYVGDDAPFSADGTFDGETVSGSVHFENISLEQLVALIAVARADQFGVLDMLTLGDDSVLGPIIDKMTKDQQAPEEAA